MALFSKPIKTLDDLFVHTLQDIYYAENQIAKNLPVCRIAQRYTHLGSTAGHGRSRAVRPL